MSVQPASIFECSRSLSVIGVQAETPLDWNAAGNRLAFVSGNKGIYLLVRQGERFEVESVLHGHRSTVRSLLFFPNSSKDILVSAGTEGIIVWNDKDGSIVKSINPKTETEAHDSVVEVLEWVDGGRFLVSGGKVRAYLPLSLSPLPPSHIRAP